MCLNDVLLPTYPTFVVLKNHHFLTIFIGGGISILVDFCQNFWSMFWTPRTKYPILLAITLHFGAGVKKRHRIYRGKKTGNSGFWPKLYNITATSTFGAQLTCTSKHLMIMMLHTRC
ncbi:hypothetical protein PFUGPA_05936 [Plasmodium falciparum Palo Alto/Uganda]|uniref:Uncharacterized protein n=1 Tax=Plasmodium falciparum (isolate Palo Alto / Uganda) TaxID=57270 RepID=W4IPU6_PLAFP|nr:hypothetical protein PFUGPA_05936 [Plasmodium falciparum Palo Alto/Uganda]